MSTYKIKKDGTPDLRSFPKEVRNLVKQLQAKKKMEELESIKAMFTKDVITLTDLSMMKTAGTQSVFAGKVQQVA